jgi:hypothetical protein
LSFSVDLSVVSLSWICDLHIPKLEASEILCEEEISVLFAEIPTLYKFHRVLERSLADQLSDWDDQTSCISIFIFITTLPSFLFVHYRSRVLYYFAHFEFI